MFLLHERTRKSLCRVGFVALCVAPTCAVVVWAASRNGDGHRTRCEAQLSQVLGLTVTLGGIEHPEPGVVRYGDFVLADPETDAPIASAVQLQQRTTDSAILISISQLKIETGAAQTVAELLHGWLRNRTTGRVTPVQITIGELLVGATSGEIPLLDVSVRPTSEGQGAEIKFRTAEMAKESPPVVMTIVRSREARIGFRLDTQGAFEAPGNRFGPIVHLLRTLVGGHEVLVPVGGEAEKLLRVSL